MKFSGLGKKKEFEQIRKNKNKLFRFYEYLYFCEKGISYNN